MANTNGHTRNIGEYQLYVSRRASYVVHTRLNDDRSVIVDTLKNYLAKPPEDFQPGRPVLLRGTDQNKLSHIVFSADDLLDDPPHYINVLVVQPPASITTSRPGARHNCHTPSELSPAARHRLVPLSYEFALGAEPSKRLTYVIDDNGNCCHVPEAGEYHSAFQHFVSISYSEYGITLLDFVLSTDRTLPKPGGPGDSRLADFKTECAALLRKEIDPALGRIETQLRKDRGTYAPKDLTQLDVFFDLVAQEVAYVAYGNVAVYQQEIHSKINPGARRNGAVHSPDFGSTQSKQIDLNNLPIRKPRL